MRGASFFCAARVFDMRGASFAASVNLGAKRLARLADETRLLGTAHVQSRGPRLELDAPRTKKWTALPRRGAARIQNSDSARNEAPCMSNNPVQVAQGRHGMDEGRGQSPNRAPRARAKQGGARAAQRAMGSGGHQTGRRYGRLAKQALNPVWEPRPWCALHPRNETLRLACAWDRGASPSAAGLLRATLAARRSHRASRRRAPRA